MQKLINVTLCILATFLIGPLAYADYNNGNNNANNKSPYIERTYNFPSSRPATGAPVFIYNPNTVSWAAYDSNGQLVKTGPASGGRGYCPDIKASCRTPAGMHTVYSKAGVNYRSKTFPLETHGGAPMPYAMFFKGGYAIHGSDYVPSFNASHGCIRVLPADAEWLSRNFITNGTTVIVYPYAT